MTPEFKKVVDAAVLSKLRLLTISANSIPFSEGEPEDPAISVEWGTPPPVIIERDGKRFLIAICHFRVNGKTESKAPAKVETSWEAQYELTDSTIEAGQCKEFVERNVPFNIWPYARETVHSLTLKMDIRPIILPLYKGAIPKPPKPKAPTVPAKQP
jgi:hypothetical protein